MNSKNIKIVDEHNIDRTASVMFAFDLEGSEYVSYWIARDEENNNLFVSKIIKNIDGTFNLLDIDLPEEKTRLDYIVKKLVQDSVDSQDDKLTTSSLTLSDGKVLKFKEVNFNKEQRINVHKTYITTVKKEVTRVSEKYYAIDTSVLQPVVFDEIFPSVTPVTPVVETPASSVPATDNSQVTQNDNFATFGTEPTVIEPKVEATVLPSESSILEPVKEEVHVETPIVSIPQPTPTIVEPITVSSPVESVPTPTVLSDETPVTPIVEQNVLPEVQRVEPTVVSPTPLPATPEVNDSQPLVFNASKETNLNAALGEVASSATIPVENIEPIREFGVDEPVKPVVNPQPNVSLVQPSMSDSNLGVSTETPVLTQKAGFANSKFFMVVAIAFFLASCIFLGYEVFNYFQLTK